MDKFPVGGVEEVQGLYGPYGFPEKLLQRIWHDGAFDGSRARLDDGRALQVLHPGKWNHLGGPDFRGARLLLGDVLVEGDVELHLRAADWRAHGHSLDPAYDRVVLHVVLFPGHAAETSGSGRPIPVLTLLPWLWHDLEAYAADAAMAVLANQPGQRLFAELSGLESVELKTLIDEGAKQRWQTKVRHARQRVERLDRESACHHAALEILGYRFNRVAMLRVAAGLTLAEWRRDPAATAVRAWEIGAPWSLQGVRPANAPRRRLTQYAEWIGRRPDWVAGLEEWAGDLRSACPRAEETAAAARRRLRASRRRQTAIDQITGGVITGPRFDQLINDGLLPLAVAAGWLSCDEGFAWWRVGYPGDLPDFVSRGLRELGVACGRADPPTNGAAQGLLGWLWARESRH